MSLSTSPTYITINEFRINARIEDQKTLANEVLIPYILHAERIIDVYIGYIEPYDINQTMKFPTKDENGNSDIPNDLKLACIEIVMCLILQGEKEFADIDEADTQEWSANGYKIKYRNRKTYQEITLRLPSFAARLLRQWAGQTSALTFGF